MKQTIALILAVVCLSAAPDKPHPPKRIVFLVDGTGSMKGDDDANKWRFVIKEVAKSLDNLKPDQKFMVLIASGSRVERVTEAYTEPSDDSKDAAWDALRFYDPAGDDVAKSWVGEVEKLRPDLVWFVTDGSFKDDNAAGEIFAQSSARGKKYRVNTVAAFADTEEGNDVLRRIAKDSGGVCVGDAPEKAKEKPKEKPKPEKKPRPTGPSIIDEP